MRKVNANNYLKDPHFPAIAKCVAEILQDSAVVTPLDVLLRTQRITKKQVEDWRFGRIPYLERVCSGNLSKLSRILRILDCHAHVLGLKPSQTVYKKWGRGAKTFLRFSKSGEPHLEAAYARHYVARERMRPRDAEPIFRNDSDRSAFNEGARDGEKVEVSSQVEVSRQVGVDGSSRCGGSPGRV